MTAFRSILPPDAATRLPLVWVMAIMSYLAALSLAGALLLNRATSAWTSDLAGSVTVQIKPDAAMATDAQRAKALEILNATPGVAAARALADAELKALLEPWLGHAAELTDLPVPILIDVTVNPDAAPDLAALGAKLGAAIPGAVLDDHRSWNERLLRFSDRLALVGLAVPGLILLAAVAIVVFATRAGLRSNHETVEVLHLVGARDGFIAREFERHFLGLGLRAGLYGAATAFATMLGLGVLATRNTFLLPHLTLAWPDPFALLLIPFTAALVAMITARLTVLGVLRAMP